MIQKYTWMTDHTAPRRLDHLLEAYLSKQEPRLSKTKIRKLILAGGVQIDGHITRICSKIVPPQKKIDLSFRPDSLFKPQSLPPEILTLFEDDALLIVNKPAGLPTQPTVDPLRHNVYSLLKAKVKPYLGLHHRLDRDTSGVLLFTKDKAVNRSIADQFKSRSIEKTYLALVEGKGLLQKKLHQVWEVNASLRSSRIRGIQHMLTVKKGGLEAKTAFQVLAKKDTIGLVSAKPLTGRMHQIRVHLSYTGLPILGDSSYHSKQKSTRILLHAFELTLEHPKLKTPLSIQAPLPKDFLAALQALNIPFPSHFPSHFPR